MNILAGNRMDKIYIAAMERLTVNNIRTAAVKTISQQRVSDIGHMDSNLVGTTCKQLESYQTVIPILRQGIVSGHSVFAVGTDSALYYTVAASAYGRVHHARFVHNTRHKSIIILVYFSRQLGGGRRGYRASRGKAKAENR